ncbi:hypothetical protein FBQ95_17230 [Chloroflexi bacterium CFX3]|nr:hypothetical protein [Chloroflexi bacterium CFX3]
MWTNRIVSHGEADPQTLKAHPHNWRVHTSAQREALNAVLQEIGLVRGVIVNQRSGLLLDGHLRVEEAIRHNVPRIPVTYVDLDTGEEALILATFDALTRMAQADAAMLDNLLQSLRETATPLQALLDTLAGSTQVVMDRGADYVRPENLLPGTQARVGVYIFRIERAVFLAWQEELRQTVGFHDKDIALELLRRLGFETGPD